MALWIPGPWEESDDPTPQPESPHQAAIAQPVKQAEPKRRRSPKSEA